jgi:hypothetical protein
MKKVLVSDRLRFDGNPERSWWMMVIMMMVLLLMPVLVVVVAGRPLDVLSLMRVPYCPFHESEQRDLF